MLHFQFLSTHATWSKNWERRSGFDLLHQAFVCGQHCPADTDTSLQVTDFGQKHYQENTNDKSPDFSIINLANVCVSNESVQAFEKVDDDNGDNSIHVAVNFGASTTTEVSTGLVEQSVVSHYSLAFLADVLGAAEMCNLSTVPGDGGSLGTWISRAVNSPPKEQHTARIGFSPLMKECPLRMAALWLIHSTHPLART